MERRFDTKYFAKKSVRMEMTAPAATCAATFHNNITKKMATAATFIDLFDHTTEEVEMVAAVTSVTFRHTLIWWSAASNISLR